MSLEDYFYSYLGNYKQLPDWAKIALVAPFKILPRRFYLGKSYDRFVAEAELLNTWIWKKSMNTNSKS